MKLNPDCVRDIMLFLENNLSISSDDLKIIETNVFTIAKSLDYPIGEIANTLLVLGEANFIKCPHSYANNRIYTLNVSHITYSGYEFIERIRPKTVWDKVKKIGANIGSLSIDMISNIAIDVIAQLVNGQLYP